MRDSQRAPHARQISSLSCCRPMRQHPAAIGGTRNIMRVFPAEATTHPENPLTTMGFRVKPHHSIFEHYAAKHNASATYGCLAVAARRANRIR